MLPLKGLPVERRAVQAAIPPSALPGISPSRGEIDLTPAPNWGTDLPP